MTDIVLCTINARFVHAALGLRYLRANLGPLRERSEIVEFVLGQRSEAMAETLLAKAPLIIGFGVYIWNVEETTRLIAQLKVLAPQIAIVIGGPEVSYEVDQQRIAALADYTITGWGDISFAELASELLAGRPVAERVIAGKQPPLDVLTLPYGEYSDVDARSRHIYVEASRGCPFKCEFCLSALDKTAWPFPLEPFLAELEALYQRGARHFKFVDRTFNLKVDTSVAILRFFLDKIAACPDDPPFAHFELIPDHLPDRLKALIAEFPPGLLQFEIGIQTFDEDTQARISRRQKNALAESNLRWLREHSRAHLHVDLIAGLPGETLSSFAAGFDRLVALAPQEIQFGILKRLRGAPIARHAASFDLRFSPDPPYTVLSTSTIDFVTMQRLVRFARYWDLIANSGRFPTTLPLLLGHAPFDRFLALSDGIYAHAGQAHGIAHDRLVMLIQAVASATWPDQQAPIELALVDDYRRQGGRMRLPFDSNPVIPAPRSKRQSATPPRQARHLAGSAG